MGASKWFFSMSGVILLIGGLAIAGKGINFGIDFESGTRITAALQQSVDPEKVRSILASEGYADAKIQTVQNPALGKHVIQVCLGTACHVRGAPRVLDRILLDLKMGGAGTTNDLQFTVETVRCIGCCGLAPVARVDNKNTHPHLTQAKVGGLLKKYQDKAEATRTAKPDEASHAEA